MDVKLHELFSIKEVTKNYTPPEGMKSLKYWRDAVTPNDVRKKKLEMVHGFNVTWYYTGVEVEPVAEYSNYLTSLTFARNRSISFHI